MNSPDSPVSVLGFFPLQSDKSLEMYELPHNLFGPRGPLSQMDYFFVQSSVKNFCTFCHSKSHLEQGDDEVTCPSLKLLLSWRLQPAIKQCVPVLDRAPGGSERKLTKSRQAGDVLADGGHPVPFTAS